MNEIKVRPARPDDAPLAAVAFRLSMPQMSDYLFGADGRQAELALMRLFASNAGRFGYGQAFVAEWNRQSLGLMTAFPGRDLRRLNWSVAKGLPRAVGFKMVGLLLRYFSLPDFIEAESGEYYISNLAILPAAQGNGLGTRLLSFAEGQARSLHLKKISLTVSLDNVPAMQLYQRRGYQIVHTQRDVNPLLRYHRMVKNVAQ